MKLRAIELMNVRRFTERVRIADIQDGVNVLTAANEQGKSTVFDALQALFTLRYSSQARPVKSLSPHAGGAPEITVELETPEGAFIVSKRWLSKPEARVTRDGKLIAQADQAEAWISGLLGDGDAAPAALLWVRQGSAGLDDGTNQQQQAALGARQNLLATVAGAVDEVAGGQRLDAVLQRCVRALDTYATAGGKPRAGGPWRSARDDVEQLRAQQDALATRVRALQEAIGERRRLRGERDALDTPEAAAEREARLDTARMQLASAEQHAAEVRASEQALQTATLAAEQAHAALSSLQRTLQDQASAQTRVRDTTAALAAAETHLAEAERLYTQATTAHQHDTQVYKDAESVLRRVQARDAARAGAQRRTALEDRLKQARQARQAVEQADAAAQIGPKDADLDQLQALSAQLTTARALRDSTAMQVVMRYAAGQEGRVTQDGAALEHDSPLRIHSATRLQLGDLGELTIHPAEGQAGLDDVERAEAALSAALRALGVESLEAARRAHQARTAAEQQRQHAETQLTMLAPEGIEALARQLAEIPAPAMAEDTELPAMDQAQAALQRAGAALEASTAQREAARERRDLARTAHAEAVVRRDGAQERLDATASALARLPASDEAALSERADEAARAKAEAAEQLTQQRAAAPDIEFAKAAFARAQSVANDAQKRLADIRARIAVLDERIDSSAGESVEEQLQETEEQLDVAARHLALIEREVAVLQRLRSALESARNAAREQYFQPVSEELRPLLRMLWPDAVLRWTDDTLLPAALHRNNLAETIDILSGGTQEQLNLLVRLAFARLAARHGRHTPVILDDALVFTDDERIETMFTALHRQAEDIQIIVLSCRQRAFQHLGGTGLQITDVQS